MVGIRVAVFVHYEGRCAFAVGAGAGVTRDLANLPSAAETAIQRNAPLVPGVVRPFQSSKSNIP